MRKRADSRHGFTLIELALVLVITLVLIWLAVPLFHKKFQDLRVENTSRTIAKTARYLQEVSILQKTSYSLQYDEAGRAFKVKRLKATEDGNVSAGITGRLGRPIGVPRDCEITIDPVSEEGPGFILFNPDGRMGTVIIRILHKSGWGKIVTIKDFPNPVGIEDIYEEK